MDTGNMWLTEAKKGEMDTWAIIMSQPFWL